MSSLFQNLYKFRETEKIHQKENFLTEIFAHCLNSDKEFLCKFLNEIGYPKEPTSVSCSTQHTALEWGRPDIKLKLSDDTLILIECKIGASLGNNQLERYAEYATKQAVPNKFLVLISRDYMVCPGINNNVKFKAMRWFEIYSLLSPTKNELIREFANYLNAERMSTKIKFQLKELKAIQDILATKAKMDEFLAIIETSMKEYGYTNIQLDNSLAKSGDYGKQAKFGEGLLWIGFYQYEDHEEVNICVSLYKIPLNSSLSKKISERVKEPWETYPEYDNTTEVWYIKKGLSSFFNDEIFDADAALDFVKAQLELIKTIL
jgi:hypothetical protein